MRPFGKFFTIAFMAILVVGCASGPKFSEMQSSIPKLNSDTGRIFIYVRVVHLAYSQRFLLMVKR